LLPVLTCEWDDIALGPALIDKVPADGPRSYQLCRGGTHVDVAARRVGVWTTSNYEGLVLGWPRLWPGWTLVRWGADAEPHRSAVAEAVEIAEPPLDLDAYGARLDRVWLMRLRERLSDPVFYAEITIVDESLILPFVAADLTEQAYRDLRERAVGSRHNAEEDRRARANTDALRRRGWTART
jgi:hypothetical protein